jgi:hypothetical protein
MLNKKMIQIYLWNIFNLNQLNYPLKVNLIEFKDQQIEDIINYLFHNLILIFRKQQVLFI